MPDDDPVGIIEVLRPGVTRPHVDNAARACWLTAVHDAMRAAGGTVTAAAEEPTVGRNHYRVGVATGAGVARSILFNAAALVVAAAESEEISPRHARKLVARSELQESRAQTPTSRTASTRCGRPWR